MTEHQTRSVLQAHGYTDISAMERHGDEFRINKAKRYGRDLENLRVDARTGQMHDQSPLNDDQVRKMLEERDYSDVSDLRRDGETIRAKAKRDDSEVDIRINAKTGVITPLASN